MKRKGLLAVVLATIAALCGVLAPHYYTWNISYEVNPLVKNHLTLKIGARSGATSIIPYSQTETDALSSLPKKANLTFKIFQNKSLDEDGVNDLEELFRDWYYFNVTFEVCVGGTPNPNSSIEFIDADGDGNIDNGEVSQNPAVITLNPDRDYNENGTPLSGELPVDIKWTVKGITRVLTSHVSESVPVAIYAVETQE